MLKEKDLLNKLLELYAKQENIKFIGWEDYRPYIIYLSEDFSSILNSSLPP